MTPPAKVVTSKRMPRRTMRILLAVVAVDLLISMFFLITGHAALGLIASGTSLIGASIGYRLSGWRPNR